MISSRLSRKVLLPYSVTNSSFSGLLLLASEPSEWDSATLTFAKEPSPDVLMNMGDRGRMEFVGSTARQIWFPVKVSGRMSDTAIFLFGINCSRHSVVPCMSSASRGTKDSPVIRGAFIIPGQEWKYSIFGLRLYSLSYLCQRPDDHDDPWASPRPANPCHSSHRCWKALSWLLWLEDLSH